jgi:hypothetical protein
VATSWTPERLDRFASDVLASMTDPARFSDLMGQLRDPKNGARRDDLVELGRRIVGRTAQSERSKDILRRIEDMHAKVLESVGKAQQLDGKSIAG